jgi:hypothetical protein
MNGQESWTVGNVQAICDERSETLTKSCSRPHSHNKNERYSLMNILFLKFDFIFLYDTTH